MASALMNMMVDEEKKAGRQVVRPTKTVRKPVSNTVKQMTEDAEAKEANELKTRLTDYNKRLESTTPEKPLVDVGDLSKSFAGASLPIRDVRPEKSGIFAPGPSTAAGKVGREYTGEAGDISSAFLQRYGSGKPRELDVQTPRTPEEEEQYRAAQNRIAAGEDAGLGKQLEQGMAARNPVQEAAPSPSLGQWIGKGARPAQQEVKETPPVGGQDLLDEQGNLRQAVDFFDKPFTSGEKKFGTAKDFLPGANPQQKFETRENPTANQPRSNNFTANLDSDGLLASFQGNELPTMTMVGKLKSSVTAGVSLPEAARRVFNGATDADRNSPIYKVLEAYNTFQGNARTDGQKRILNDGLAAIADYFDRGSKPGSKHSTETFNDAVDLFKLAGDPDYRPQDVYDVSPALMDAMNSDENSIFATKFGSQKDRSERTKTRRFDAVYTGINKSVSGVAKKVLTNMSRGNAPAFVAARDIATSVLGPLSMAQPEGMSSVDWTESNTVRRNIVDSIYMDVADMYERRNMGKAFSFNEAMGNDIVARRFGGQFDIAATLRQITEPKFSGREAAYVKDMQAAQIDQQNNNNTSAAKKAAPYYTTQALQMMYGDTGVEGYDSGRTVGVSTGAGSDLVSNMRASEQRMIEADIKRDVKPLRTDMTPHQLLGALFAEQGVPSSLFSFATPRLATTEAMTSGEAPTGKTTNFKLQNHPDSVLQVTSKSGTPINFDDRKYILKMQGLLEGAENPTSLMKQLQTDPRFKELSKRNTFTLGRTRNLDIVQNEFGDMGRGARVVSGSQSSLETMADVVSDLKQLMRIPEDENGVLYVDKAGAEMYDTAKAMQTRLKTNLDMYEKRGDEYALTSSKASADYPSVLTPDQYSGLRGALSQLNSLIASADDIRSQVGGIGVSTGFQLKGDGTPDFMRPRQVSGPARLDQTLDMLDHWASGGSEMNFKKLFSGINLVEGGRQSTRSTVQLMPVDVNGRTINDKNLIKSYDVDPKTGTANVQQFQLKDGRYVPVIGEDGKPKTVKVRTNQQTERVGVSTVATQSASQGKYGLPSNYVVSSFNQFHSELNTAFKNFPEAVDSFAKYVLFTGDEDVIKQLGETGITQQELQRVVTDMSRRQGSALHSILEIARGRDFKPDSRAPGTMNGTSGPRSSESRLERDVINKVDAGDRRAAEDIIIQNHKTKIQSAFATARNIYLQEGSGTDKESQITRIVKSVLEDRTSDVDITPELRPAFEQAVKDQVTSLVYEDKNNSRARMSFMDAVYGYAGDVVTEQAEAGNVRSAPNVKGAGVDIGEGKGRIADQKTSRKNLVTTAITDAINLVSFGADSKARKSLIASKSTFAQGIDMAIKNFESATTSEAKNNALSDLVKRIATAKNNGINMPTTADGVASSGGRLPGFDINIAELDLSPAQKRKLDMTRKRVLLRQAKLGIKTEDKADNTPITTDTTREQRPRQTEVASKPQSVDYTKMSSGDISQMATKVIREIKQLNTQLGTAKQTLQQLRGVKPAKANVDAHLKQVAEIERTIKTLQLQVDGKQGDRQELVGEISKAKVREEQVAQQEAKTQGKRQRVKINNALGLTISNADMHPGYIDVLESANTVFNRNGKVMTKADAVKVLMKAGLSENSATGLLTEVNSSKGESAGFNRGQLDKKYAVVAQDKAKFVAMGTRIANGLFKSDVELTQQRAAFKPTSKTPAPIATQKPVVAPVKPQSRADAMRSRMRGSTGKAPTGFMTLLGIGKALYETQKKDN
jgi:hypothetical protein